MVDERTRVLVVGAGLAGSAATLFLARRGIDVLLVERHQSAATHPRITGQSQRTAELLLSAGVEPTGECTQDKIEPVLLEHAERAGAGVRFATEVVDLIQDPTGVTVRLLNQWNWRLTTVRADYVIAADGHRSPIREALGIRRHGRGALRHTVEVSYVRKDTPGRHLVSFEYHPDRGESVLDFTTEVVTDLIRLADPDLDIEVESVQAWEVGASVADRFADGRVFLAGDAAKAMPPHGSASGDAAIGDAYDLAWKLADVVNGVAGRALLDTYDTERRPLADQLVSAALHEARTTMPWLDLTGEPEPEVSEAAWQPGLVGEWTLVTEDDAWRQAAERFGIACTAGEVTSLVRPDGVVAWLRTDEAADALAGVLRGLGREPVRLVA
ncbi:MAG TPA: FAD-dependent oxidoreductase [Pseudonocardiaceae bacterium]|jgi:2-polyprenyl-6-methoxyphenol hydroxylase-like FAD-dependent oxidoreductase